jgi:AhpD family alkylhydroperoxidase
MRGEAMARVPLLTTDDNVAEEVRAVFESVKDMGLERFMNQFSALAHHPALTQAIHGLMQAYYSESLVDKKYLELAILMVSHLNRCNYCVVHHTPPALSNGVSAAQIGAIEDGSWQEGQLFTPIERAVLLFAKQMNTRKGRIDDSLFAELGQIFSPAQIIELTVRVGMCEFYNRFNEAMQLDVEPVAEALYAQAEG